LGIWTAPAYKPTQEEKARSQAAAAGTEFLCGMRSTCVQYAPVRQQCAVAGNFSSCVAIKMGGPDPTDYCTPDGQVAHPPPDLPTVADCLLRGYFKVIPIFR